MSLNYLWSRASRGCLTRVSQTSYGSQAAGSRGAFLNSITAADDDADRESVEDAARAMT